MNDMIGFFLMLTSFFTIGFLFVVMLILFYVGIAWLGRWADRMTK